MNNWSTDSAAMNCRVRLFPKSKEMYTGYIRLIVTLSYILKVDMSFMKVEEAAYGETDSGLNSR